MVELGELERHHADFAQRGVRVVAISNDRPPAAQATQSDFPNLVIVSDADQSMAKAIEVIHAGAGAQHDDTNAPTTFLVDGVGRVRWMARSSNVLARPSPAEVLQAIDKAGL